MRSMNPPQVCLRLVWAGVVGGLAVGAGRESAAQELAFSSVELTTRREIRMRLTAPAGSYYVLQASSNLLDWRVLLTARAAASNEQIDSRPLGEARFYRVQALADAPSLTGDHLPTERGDAVIRPVNHAAVVVGWGGLALYVDPSAGSYTGLPKAEVALVTHSHGDHFNATTLGSVVKDDAVIVVPQAVLGSLPEALRARAMVLTNGATATVRDMRIEAVPAYNANHPRGAGNGYVVTLGGRRLYFSGDTGNTPEMRALQGIDAAFLAMNVPFTMTVNDATNAVHAFRPQIVYPYHYRDQSGSTANAALFRDRLGAGSGVEVRLRTWY